MKAKRPGPRIYVQMSVKFPEYVWAIGKEDGTVIAQLKTNEALIEWWINHGYSEVRLIKEMNEYMTDINRESY